MTSIALEIVFSSLDRRYRFIQDLVNLGRFRRTYHGLVVEITAHFDDDGDVPGGTVIQLQPGYFPQLERICRRLASESSKNEGDISWDLSDDAHHFGGKVSSTRLLGVALETNGSSSDGHLFPTATVDPMDEFDDYVRLEASSDLLNLGSSLRPLLLEKLSLVSIAKRCSPIGRAVRELLWDEPRVDFFAASQHRPDVSEKHRHTLKDLDIISVTTDRFRCVLHLAQSIRKCLGWEPTITVAVQARIGLVWRLMARRYRVTLIDVPWDYGLSACRNKAVTATERPIILLTDDDFQLDERSDVLQALKLIGNNGPSIVGGNLTDVDLWNTPRADEESQGFAMKGELSSTSLKWIRLEDLKRHRIWLDPGHYIEECDIVDNFALIDRNRIFGQNVSWSNELKIGAEHQDLYLKLLRDSILIVRTNLLKVRNVKYRNSRFRKMRNRTDFFWSIFFDLHSLDTMEIVGERIRGKLHDGVTFHSQANSRWRMEFFEKHESI